MNIHVLIWAVFIAGALASRYFFGFEGRIVYYVIVLVVIAVFRRQLVIGLTHVASTFGMMKQTIDRMPAAIHLEKAPALDEAAKPIARELAAAGFVDAGAWNIRELPKIRLGLLVHPADKLFAAIETASSIGAQVNIHTLYDNGDVTTCTNSRLPAPKVQRPGVTSIRLPGVSARATLDKARTSRRQAGISDVSEREAPALYERLYADAIRHRKAVGT